MLYENAIDLAHDMYTNNWAINDFNPGQGGSFDNASPTFYPNTINEVSWFEFKITPDELKPLVAGTSSIILIFPPLPTTVPMSYILPYTGLECYFHIEYSTKFAI